MLRDPIAKTLSDAQFAKRVIHDKRYKIAAQEDAREIQYAEAIDQMYKEAVMDVRRAIEVEGVHWEAACDRVIGLYPLGLTQIADIYAEAERRHE